MTRISLTALLLVVGCSFVSSGILTGPIRGYSTSFASSQTQRYDPRNGYFSDVTVTSRQCSVVRRSTRYIKEQVPFLCQVTTGRVVPLPPPSQSNNVKLLQAMKAGGWTMCSKVIHIPIHRFQRIRVCCPGTVPTPKGGCLNRNDAGSDNSPSQRQGGPFPLYQGQQPQDPRVTKPVGHIPIIVKAPGPYRRMMNLLSGRGPSPSLIQQVMFPRGRAGPAYTTDSRVGPRVGVASSPMGRRPAQDGPPRSEWQNELARFVAAMMYHKMLAEHAEKRLQDEFDRQNRIRQQIELAIAQHIYMVQQKQKQQQQLMNERMQPTTTSPISDSDSDLVPEPGPAPAPPVQNEEDTPFNEELTSQQAPGGETEAEPMGDEQGDGILDRMPHLRQPAPTNPTGPQLVGNFPNMPQAPQRPLQVQMAEIKAKVKTVVDGCLEKGGLTTSIEQIMQSGDLNRLQPVCRARETVGPCMMTETDKVLGQDQLSLVGRRLMRSVLLSLGQVCMRLEQANQMPSGPVMTPPKMTSAPVFPNPAPSMTKTEVTAGPAKVKATEPPAVKPVVPEKKFEEEKSAKRLEEPPRPKTTPAPIAKHGAHAQRKEKDEAAFPMWMILTMVGACAALLLFCCLTVCLVVRCRRKRKDVELDRQPEKLPVPAEGNFYAASPCVAPPAYNTTAVKQTMGGEEDDCEFKIPEDDTKEKKDEEKEGAHP